MLYYSNNICEFSSHIKIKTDFQLSSTAEWLLAKKKNRVLLIVVPAPANLDDDTPAGRCYIIIIIIIYDAHRPAFSRLYFAAASTHKALWGNVCESTRTNCWETFFSWGWLRGNGDVYIYIYLTSKIKSDSEWGGDGRTSRSYVLLFLGHNYYILERLRIVHGFFGSAKNKLSSDVRSSLGVNFFIIYTPYKEWKTQARYS